MTEDPRALAARLLAKSRYAMPRAQALAHIEARRRRLLAPPAEPEPDLTAPEPLSLALLNAPEKYASDFWTRRSSREKPRPGRPPSGDALGPRHDDFRVVDGDKKD